MTDLNIYSIVVARIEYADGTGSKVRPALVVSVGDEVVKTFRITSQYQFKSDVIKAKYFEIIDWYKAGLRKPSWIDTVRFYEIDSDKVKIKIIGRLSERDIDRLKVFLSDRDIY